jgi:pimeloyl-ACP methyl ester carboxylesterase
MNGARLRAASRFLRWLGPWATDRDRPRKIRRRAVTIDGRFDAWVYEPRREPDAAVLVVPGLHYLGPADVRMDRFLSIVADAGALVICPFLPEMRVLHPGEACAHDVRLTFDALSKMAPEIERPGVMSISFGNYSALHLAISDPRVSSLLFFGGYASMTDTVSFSLEGRDGLKNDPLNRPAVFINLLPHIDRSPDDKAILKDAWVTFARSTWGRPWMKDREVYGPIARRMAEKLPAASREMFLIGCGVEEGGLEIARAAIERGREPLSRFDPIPHCPNVRVPVTIIHGKDDDVIPYTHAQELYDALPNDIEKRVLVTGLYTHSGHGLVGPRQIADEVKTLGEILAALASVGRD